MPYVENDPQEMKINSEIQSILNTAWDGKQLKEEERKQVNFSLIFSSISSLKKKDIEDISYHALTNTELKDYSL